MALQATKHAVDRAWQRLRLRLRAGLVEWIGREIELGRASYLGKGRRHGHTVWGLRLSREQPVRIVINERAGTLVTVLPSTGEGVPGYASRTGYRRPAGLRRANKGR